MMEALELHSLQSNLSSPCSLTLRSRLPICNCDLSCFGPGPRGRGQEPLGFWVPSHFCLLPRGLQLTTPPPNKAQGSVAVGGGLPYGSHSPLHPESTPPRVQGLQGPGPVQAGGVPTEAGLGPGHRPASRQLLFSAGSSTLLGPCSLSFSSSLFLPPMPLPGFLWPQRSTPEGPLPRIPVGAHSMPLILQDPIPTPSRSISPSFPTTHLPPSS